MYQVAPRGCFAACEAHASESRQARFRQNGVEKRDEGSSTVWERMSAGLRGARLPAVRGGRVYGGVCGGMHVQEVLVPWAVPRTDRVLQVLRGMDGGLVRDA